ncbi:MAG: hypothetical protein Fur009_6020 [Candidatus Microgenomates bacterium]
MKKILPIILGVVFAYFVFLIFKTQNFYKKIYTSSENKKQNITKTQYNFLILGYGGGSHDGAYLTDTIMIFHLDTSTKKASLLSIPRDLWVKIPTKDASDFFKKINALYQIELYPENYPPIDHKFLGKKNDASLTKYIIAKNFNIPIDYFVAIDFDGFKKIIDILGGVDVVVEKDFTDPSYPITGKENDLCDDETEKMFKQIEPFLKPSYNPEDKINLLKNNSKLDEFLKNATSSPELAFPCRYETLVFKAGKTHMDGETALKFARSRHSLEDGSDFSRARRQHLIIEAIKNKFISLNLMTKASQILDKLGNHVKTDFPINNLANLSKEIIFANKYQFFTFVLSTKNYLNEDFSDDGQYILISKEGQDNWQKIQQAIKKIFQGVDPEATPTPTMVLKK